MFINYYTDLIARCQPYRFSDIYKYNTHAFINIMNASTISNRYLLYVYYMGQGADTDQRILSDDIKTETLQFLKLPSCDAILMFPESFRKKNRVAP